MGGMLRVLIILAILVVPVSAFAQGKIGIINLDDALSNSSVGKAALSGLKSRFESREKAIAAQGDNLKKMQNELQKKSVALSQDAMKSKAADFEAKARKYLDDRNKLQQEEQQAQQGVLQPLLNRLQKVVSEYAAKNGYTIILEARSVPYYDPKMDVTSAVRAQFDRSK
ncbi:outer membrane chaperone Skp (OmpH) [Solidesulfovibrio fructosivorans JJ]]|uniref:Outer membrane chaperone Skp (OmpH) n=1 Tax=Solidesulfovibrio fructosivorans JJ] TaxID=596151 RepID=E1K022_SOLFR|nr:OmpH family outer membrane protein [Solidesulfovibrio fructosivorans]EFL50028.1 outer membrane chaperone Skp (OmpH) [Solidesulfovibrio fructosivorans JJ]]